MRRRSQLATRLAVIFGVVLVTCLGAYAFLQREISHIHDTLERSVTGGYDMLGAAHELENLVTETAATLRRLRNDPTNYAHFDREHAARAFEDELSVYRHNAADSDARNLAERLAALHRDYLGAVDGLLGALAADALPLARLHGQVGEFALSADEIVREAGSDLRTEHELRTAVLDIERRLHDYLAVPDSVHAASLEIALRTLEHRMMLAATHGGIHPQAPFITTLRDQLRELRRTTREALEQQRAVDEALARVHTERDDLRAFIHDRLVSAAHAQVEDAEHAVYERIDQARTRVTLLLAAVLLTCAGAGYVAVRNFLRPVRQLVVALRSAGRGDLAQRVNVRANNELGEIGAAFNDMAARLERATVSRGYLDQILTALPGGVIVLDGALSVLKVNPGGCALFGGCAPALVGQNFAQLVAGEDGRPWTPVPGVTEERRITCGDRHSAVLVSATTLGGGAPDGAAYVCHVTDITRRKEAEEALANSRDELRAAYVALQRVQEDERARLAREVHDEFGAILTVMGNTAFGLDDHVRADDDKARALLERLHELVTLAGAATERIVDGLHPPILDHFGLVAALEWYVEDFKSRSGLACSLKLAPVPELNPEQSLALFRVLQESLTNVTRHARASHVQVSLETVDHAVVLSVADDGDGFDAAPRGAAELRHGLHGLAERMASLGGEFAVEGRREHGGARVEARLPLEPRAPGPRAAALYAIDGGLAERSA